jgi:sugar phosphate isomerase/epimerase
MPNEKRPLKRGVTLFSYSDLLNVCMNLEDCFKDMYDMGVTCIEILGGHIENYPNPPAAWVDNWFKLCDKYKIAPGNFGHWYDTRIYQDRYLEVDESLSYLEADLKVAHTLGFKTARTKLTTVNRNCDPVPGWEKYLEKAIVLAEKYDVKMGSEIHQPTNINTKHIQDFIDFIEKTKTKHFGFVVDFGTFQDKIPDIAQKHPEHPQKASPDPSKPKDIKKVLPYTVAIHCKYYYVDENYVEVTIPYYEVMKEVVDSGWEGCLIGEFEGPHKEDPDHVYEQMHRHQILLKRAIGY